MTDRHNPYFNFYFYRCLFSFSRHIIQETVDFTDARRAHVDMMAIKRQWIGPKIRLTVFLGFWNREKKKFIFILGVGVYESRTSYIYVYVSTRIISIEEDDAEERDIAVIKGVSPFENDLCVGGAEIQTGARTSSRTQTHRK